MDHNKTMTRRISFFTQKIASDNNGAIEMRVDIWEYTVHISDYRVNCWEIIAITTIEAWQTDHLTTFIIYLQKSPQKCHYLSAFILCTRRSSTVAVLCSVKRWKISAKGSAVCEYILWKSTLLGKVQSDNNWRYRDFRALWEWIFAFFNLLFSPS